MAFKSTKSGGGMAKPPLFAPKKAGVSAAKPARDFDADDPKASKPPAKKGNPFAKKAGKY